MSQGFIRVGFHGKGDGLGAEGHDFELMHEVGDNGAQNEDDEHGNGKKDLMDGQYKEQGKEHESGNESVLGNEPPAMHRPGLQEIPIVDHIKTDRNKQQKEQVKKRTAGARR